MDKTEKYNIASMDIHGHGCDVTELKHVLPPEEFAIETASLFGLLSDSTRLRILYLLYHREDELGKKFIIRSQTLLTESLYLIC